MKLKPSKYVPTVRWANRSPLGGFSLAFPNLQKEKSPAKAWRQICRCGKGYLCQKSCPVLEVWTSGVRCQRSFERDFIHISRRSIEGVAMVFGFTIRVCLRILPVGTTCFYNGPKSTLDTPPIFPFSVKSFYTWLHAKLTLAASVSFILSVAALGTLISVLLFFLMKLPKLKRSFLAFNQRRVKTRKRTSS